MKIFLGYGQNSNKPLIEKIKEYLSMDAEGNLKHEVWMNTSEISILSHEKCAVMQIECNANRKLLVHLKDSGFKTKSKIKRIEYLDPFEKFFA